MTRNPSGNAWAKAGLIGGGLLLVIGVWATLAGGIFLSAQDRNFNDATPVTLYQYWYYYQGNPNVLRWIYIAAAVAAVLVVSPSFLFFTHAKKSLFGDARFATKTEIRKAGLLGDKGIILGTYMGAYLMFGGSQHVILSAPTRSGKGVGIVIPNLLTWPDSVVVLDVKQENHAITSGYRKKHGQPCFLFNPAATDYRTHRYNPLFYVSADSNFRIDDVQKIGNMLFPDQQGTDPIWTATPRGLFLGVVLYLIETPGKLVTLGQVLRESLADGDGARYFARIINDRNAAGNPLSPACVRSLNSYISIASDNTRSGVMTSFRSRLELWNNPLIDAATSGNDFDLRDVRKKRMSIYLGVTPDNLERIAPLINLFFQQLIDLNTRELPERNPALKYQCLLLADEFTSMGKINILSKGISYIAGYGLRMMPIIQSPAQVIEVYGKDAAQTFTTNHAAQIVFPPKASELQTAKDVSEWLGYQTVKGVSESKRTGIFVKKAPSESHSDQRRALLLPQEITSLGVSTELVVVENCPPIMGERIQYYRDPVFVDRLKTVSKTLKALGNSKPTEQQLKAVILKGELATSIPRIDVDAHSTLVFGEAPKTVSMPANIGMEIKTIERPITAADMPILKEFGLDEYAIGFHNVSAPPAGTEDKKFLNAYSDDLCRAFGMKV